MAGEWQTTREQIIELAKKRGVDLGASQPFCGECRVTVNLFGGLTHWHTCQPPGRVQFKLIGGTESKPASSSLLIRLLRRLGLAKSE